MKTLLLSFFLIVLPWMSSQQKNVLIIGDSISIGYFPFVKEALKEVAVVEHNKGNAQHTGTGLKNIEAWLSGKKWDVIHFNWGLWDLCYRNPESKTQGNRDKINGKITFTPEQYEENLAALLKILKKTNARLIFAETTMVPSQEAGRFSGDEMKYNVVAQKLMKEYEVTINPMHKLSQTVHKKYGKGEDDVHYSEKGYELLAQPVIRSIKKALKKN